MAQVLQALALVALVVSAYFALLAHRTGNYPRPIVLTVEEFEHVSTSEDSEEALQAWSDARAADRRSSRIALAACFAVLGLAFLAGSAFTKRRGRAAL